MATLRRHGNAFTYFLTFIYIVEYVLEPSKHRVSILQIFILFQQREVTFQKQSTNFLDRPRTRYYKYSFFPLAIVQGNGSFRPRVVSAQSRFGPGSFRPGSFRPGSIRPWVVSALFGGSFRPFFLNYQACYRMSTKYIFG